MVETVDRVAAVTATRHDGTNMIVLNKGQVVRLAKTSEAYCEQHGLLEPEGTEGTATRLSHLDGGQGRPLPAAGGETERTGEGTGEQMDAIEAQADGSENRLPQLDHDNDGNPGGSLPDDTVVAQDSAFTMKHVGGGWYEIDGGGLTAPEKVQGKAEAQTRFDEIVAEDEASAGPPV